MGEQPNKGGQPFAYGYYTRFAKKWKYLQRLAFTEIFFHNIVHFD
jgi:hypothetical protein